MELAVVSPWSEPPKGSITLYTYTPEEVEILDTSSLYDSGDMASQDSGFEYNSTSEIEIKEHRIEHTEEPTPRHGPPIPAVPPPRHQPEKTRPSNLSPRDPRLRRVSLASPATLYGRMAIPMANPQNIAQGSMEDLSMEDTSTPSEGEDTLIIDFDSE